MTLTIDNAYISNIISNNDASIDIVDIESRKLLFVGGYRQHGAVGQRLGLSSGVENPRDFLPNSSDGAGSVREPRASGTTSQ